MINKEKILSVNKEKLADILLSLYDSNQDIRKQLDMVFSMMDKDPNATAKVLKKEIASLKRSKFFFTYAESYNFADRLDQLRMHIANDLSSKSLVHARKLILEFIDMHEKIFDHVDDSGGSVAAVFVTACEDLGDICVDSKIPISEMVDIVFTRVVNDNYGIYDELILYCKDALQEEGLKLLQNKLEQFTANKNDFNITYALKSIADCRKDVSDYIQACSCKRQPSTHDHLEIAKRFIQHGNGEEALKWLESVDAKACPEWQQSDQQKLRIQAFELNNDHINVQNERITLFNKTLCSVVYGAILESTDESSKEMVKQNAIKKAFKYCDPHAALSFLIDIQEFEESAKFVHIRKQDFDGRIYHILRPAAESLQKINSLAATILYREMITPILEETKYNHYRYAAKDLVFCNTLSVNVEDWKDVVQHDVYFNTLKTQHKRKTRFWAEYELALSRKQAKGGCDKRN